MRGDEDIQEKIAKLVVGSGAIPNFVWSNGLLRFKTRIWVHQDSELKLRIISTFHSSAVGGILGSLLLTETLSSFCLDWDEI
jgi:hypothetical protein